MVPYSGEVSITSNVNLLAQKILAVISHGRRTRFIIPQKTSVSSAFYLLLAAGLNPPRHSMMLLVALVSIYTVSMLGLLILFPYAGGLEIVEASSVNQYSSLSLRLSPNPAHPGSSVTVTGSLPSPNENSFAFEGTGCGFYAFQSGLIQSPNCVLGGDDGSITGSFQVSSLAQPGTYSIYVVVVFYNTLPLYSQYSPFYQSCSASQSMELADIEYPGPSTPSPPVQPTGNSAYNCMFYDSSTLEIESSAAPSITTTTTSFVLLYQTQYQTQTLTLTKVQQVHLTVSEAILTVSVTAAVTGAATRIYGKRRPGFDVEVRSGIDRKES